MTTLSVEGPAPPLRGRVRVPGDKSISHRALLLAALAGGTSWIEGLSDGDDVRRTREAVEALGAEVTEARRGGLEVRGGTGRLREPAHVLQVGNSGTAIRLLAGLCAGLPGLTVLEGDESIGRRPMDRVAVPLRQMGAGVDGREGGRLPPLVVRGGGLRGIDYALPVPSAQVKAAVLLAGLAAEGETVVREPAATRRHSEEMLAACGVDVAVDGLVVRLRPSPVQPFGLTVPGDPSQAAFWVVAACVVPGSDVVVEDVYLGPGRAGFLDVLARMGADVEVDARSVEGQLRGTLRARHAPLRGTEVAAAEIPGLVDEVPVLAVAAALAEGPTRFAGLAELRVKESDRVATLTSELAALGAGVEAGADWVVVTGRPRLEGGSVRSHGDHRIAMAMAVAGLAAAGATRIEGWDAVATSYPGFERHLRSLPGGPGGG